jgi:hypothetical protein
MHDRRKKGGERKDKKNERMHEAVAERKENAAPERPQTDQPVLRNRSSKKMTDEPMTK